MDDSRSASVCRKCGAETEIRETRPAGGAVRRRRQCVACGCRHTTYEVAGDDAAVVLRALGAERQDESRASPAAERVELEMGRLFELPPEHRAVVAGAMRAFFDYVEDDASSRPQSATGSA